VPNIPPRHLTYLRTLQLLADQSRSELATLMPHLGERGRIAEEIIKGVLSRLLPKRFSIGTGVIVSSSGDASPQTDIVIFDDFNNSPLLTEFGSCVFPVETVYATIEVKSVLTAAELRKSLAAIRQLRAIGSKRHYLVPSIQVTNDGKASLTVMRQTLTVPPRSYVVAFAQRGLGRTFQDFCKKLSECCAEQDDFVHGVCVLNKNWFAGRIAFKPPTELHGDDRHGLLSLYSAILRGQRNYAVYPMDLDAYLPPPSSPP
jgi:hypothetical protein